ncbi:hypothetical protein ACSNOJ_00590 [Streptomyces sp. URMC 128]
MDGQISAAVPTQSKGSRFIALNTTGHCPHLIAPEETAQAITAFARTPR